MDEPYRMFKRRNIYYAQHRETGRQTSLKTKNRSIALKKLTALNDNERQPFINTAMAKVYLDLQDPEISKRTWASAMSEFEKRGIESTRWRKRAAHGTKHFDLIRKKKIMATTSTDFLAVLESGGTATNCHLKKLHNFVLSMGWLPKPILPKGVWPKPKERPKRAVTHEEHELIVSTEENEEHRRYYEMVWETGGAQGDVAALSDRNLTPDGKHIVYTRRKTGVKCFLSIGPRLQELIEQLPREGLWFPVFGAKESKHRAAEFKRRCRLLGIEGVTLHSYRYAWAERACAAGYPERYAQAALGHSSKAVHRAYAGAAFVNCPPLETYEVEDVERASESPGSP